MNKKLSFFLFLNLFIWNAKAQVVSEYVQFSGVVVSTDTMEAPVAFSSVYDLNSGLMLSANHEGFFSMVVRPGDSIQFISVGYTTRTVIIPQNITNDKLFLKIYMVPEVFSLPLVHVYPWGSRSNFDNYFINTPIPDDDYDRAVRNLNADSLAALAANMTFPSVNAHTVLTNYASSYYSYGQYKTYAITNPIAWANFLKMIANGGLKKK